MYTYILRMMLTGAMMLICACALERANAVPQHNASNLTDQLVQLEKERLDAYVHQDAGALERDLAPEYVHTNLYGTRTNKHEEIAGFYTSGRLKLTSGDIAHPVVHLYGDVAVLLADITWTGASYTPENRPPVDLSGVYSITRVYVKSGGRWLVVASHASRRPTTR
jgi:hypothetical protein